MNKCPIQQAIEATPCWFYRVPEFDGLEIHPVRDSKWDDATQGKRLFSSNDDLETWCEPCEPDEAHFWSVYGHFASGGVDCIEDFATEAEARAFAEQLLAIYPHLRHHGIWG